MLIVAELEGVARSNGKRYVVLNGKNKDITSVIFNGMEMVLTFVSLYNMKKETMRAMVEHPARSGNRGEPDNIFSTTIIVKMTVS